jgi:hypothetical protein
MSEGVHDQFLRKFDTAEIAAEFMFNDVILLFYPYFFAARANPKFRHAAGGCTLLPGLLRSDAGSIAPTVMQGATTLCAKTLFHPLLFRRTRRDGSSRRRSGRSRRRGFVCSEPSRPKTLRSVVFWR